MNDPLFLIDFRLFILPAARALLQGQSPYSVDGFFNPPWSLIPLLPLAFLPDRIAEIVYLFCIVLCLFLVVRLQGLNAWRAATFLLSFPVLWSVIVGNLEWLVLLGLFLPPRWGILLLMIKPQVGIGVVIYWLFEAYQRGELLKVLAPLCVAIAISVILFGSTLSVPTPESEKLTGHSEAGAFPWLVPMGVYWLYQSIARKRPGQALYAAPCLSPHLIPGSWAGAVLALASEPSWIPLVGVPIQWLLLLWQLL